MPSYPDGCGGSAARSRQGSKHEIWENPANGRTAAVPRHHSQEIPSGTLRKILSELGLDPSDLIR